MTCLARPLGELGRHRAIVLTLATSATIAKLLIAAQTFGTNDVHYWIEFAQGVRTFGPVGIYGHAFFAQYNHPPLAGWILWTINGLTRAHVASFPFLIRVPASLADLGTGVLMFELLRRREALRVAAIAAVLVVWSPVLLVVSGFHGNTDPVFVMFILLSLHLLSCERPAGAGASIAVALSIKLVPVVLGPVLLWALVQRGRRHVVRFVCGAALPMLVLWVPVMVMRWPEFEANVLRYQGIWLRQWGIVQFSDWLHGPSATIVDPGHWVTLLLSAGLPLLIVGRHPERLDVAVGTALVLFLLLSPAFGMQYLVWPLAAATLVHRRLGALYNLSASFFVLRVYGDWNGHLAPWRWHEAVGQPFDEAEFALMVMTWVALAAVAVAGLRVATTRRVSAADAAR